MNYAFIKKNIPLKNGEFPVYLRIFDNKTSRYISLKFSVKDKNWNEKKQIIKATDREYITKNRKIKAYKNVCESIILDSIINRENLSLDLFKKRILNNDSTLFLDYAKSVIEKKSIKTSTKKEYLGRLDWIYNFINSETKIVDFSESFLNDLKYKLIQDGNSLTTVSNIFAVISIVLNVAVKDEIIKYNYCKNITISKDTKEKEALSLDELKLIENLIPGLKSKSKIAAKLFLISAKTGLSKTDIDHFKMSDIKTIVLKGKNYYLLKGHSRLKDFLTVLFSNI